MGVKRGLEAWVRDEPAFDGGGLVGADVVCHDVHVEVGGDLFVDEVRELAELL